MLRASALARRRRSLPSFKRRGFFIRRITRNNLKFALSELERLFRNETGVPIDWPEWLQFEDARRNAKYAWRLIKSFAPRCL